ncbi:MAG TPA: tyrosine-protein kinase family protein [Gammaproteobacteria bacterium]|nr:tyrosine-protein kinase family protein [Gammaproteobacteria bacterium]
MSTIEKAVERLGRYNPEEPEFIRDQELEDIPEQADVRQEASPREGGEGETLQVDLDLARLRLGGLVTPDSERSQIAEEFRHIKRPLLMNAFGQGALNIPHGNLIMVTSSRPNEGKTFTAVNLAMSIAIERDRTVLLVDADVAKPSVARILGIPGSAGLVDYLADQDKALSELMLKTNLASLRILPAGRRHHHSTELLASESMRCLADELAQRYPDRVVIFDSPPLLATSEAAVLAGLVGQIVLVVESDRTKREELKEALALLDPEQYTALVLNKTRRPFGADYPYYSYGGYGGYGAADD